MNRRDVKQRILYLLDSGPKSKQYLMNNLGYTRGKKFLSRYVRPLMMNGLVERTVPDKPRSNCQMYRLTVQGRTLKFGLDRLYPRENGPRNDFIMWAPAGGIEATAL